MNRNELPLQQGLSRGSHVIDEPLTALIMKVAQTDDVLRVRAGIFYKSQVAGCSCADDPTPVNNESEYCEVLLDINIYTSAATITLIEN